ncbi:MAG: hypothetical protein M1830_007591, partial [Pleopsidium flavum]
MVDSCKSAADLGNAAGPVRMPKLVSSTAANQWPQKEQIREEAPASTDYTAEQHLETRIPRRRKNNANRRMQFRAAKSKTLKASVVDTVPQASGTEDLLSGVSAGKDEHALPGTLGKTSRKEANVGLVTNNLNGEDNRHNPSRPSASIVDTATTLSTARNTGGAYKRGNEGEEVQSANHETVGKIENQTVQMEIAAPEVKQRDVVPTLLSHSVLLRPSAPGSRHNPNNKAEDFGHGTTNINQSTSPNRTKTSMMHWMNG